MPHLKEVAFRKDLYPGDGHYPYNLPLLYETPGLVFRSPVTFFAGENGSGKSTILKAIGRKCGIHMWEGERRRRFSKSPHEEDLHNCVDLLWSEGPVPGSFFSSELFRNFAQALDEFASADPGMLDYFGGSSLMNQSHGQALLSFFTSRYSLEGLYLLDEPETALSPGSQIELLEVLSKASVRGEAQFIIATHSPILLALPGAEIFGFDSSPLQVVPYEETEYYRVYREFMNDRKKFLG